MMGGIGLGELVVMVLILGMLVGVPLLVVMLTRRSSTPMLPCRACGRPVMQQAMMCPGCGHPRG